MTKIIIATVGDWNIKNAQKFSGQRKDVRILTKPQELVEKNIKRLKPSYIFFPHWSWIIPSVIYESFCCIAFHMTDLPFGRGGSPLQNLIARGFKKTKISAFQVVKELDAGPIYLKKPLSLKGTAQEIYERASDIIFQQMIPSILKHSLKPTPQSETSTISFKRRKPHEGDVKDLKILKEVYDYIRMLDAPGYPKAFIETNALRFLFSQAQFKNNKLCAHVEIEVKS